MKVVNPLKDKRPSLIADELFMLWCPKRKMYVIAAITLWYLSSSRYVIRDVQGQLDGDIAAFCVTDSCGEDLFGSVNDASKSLTQGGYTIYYT